MTTPSQRVAAVLTRIRDAERAAGRPPGSVTLIGASKTQSASAVQAAFDAGVLHFGENYAQELSEKASAVGGATWHFIGHLQRNKAKLVVAHAAWLHTLDTTRLADHLDRLLAESGGTLNTLIEVNVGGEATKAGLTPEGLLALAEHTLGRCPHLKLTGLMTIPPPAGEPRASFERLRGLRDQLEAHLGQPLPHLSMGMSDDLEEAIACGATFVRVGTALFGARVRG